MNQLPLIPSRTCRHHCSTPFPPSSEAGAEDSAEQSQFFQDVALWIFHEDERVQDPMGELQNPKYNKLLDEIRCFHRANYRFLRLVDNNLRLGMSTDCPFCQWMAGWLQDKYDFGQSRTEYFVLLCCDEETARFDPFKLADSWFNSSDPDEVLEHYLDMKAYFFTWAPSEQRHLLTRSASLENVLNRARTWLHACANEHINCAHRAGPFIPTRILEISSHESIKKVRLIESKSPLPSYATLSYCWGVDVQPVWLTSAVLQQYKQGIDIASLPQTIQDAVTVTEGLDIWHLWIDALCIIQDDEMDKNREIDQMGNIFEGSTITVLASRASSVTAGFLKGNIRLDKDDVPWVLETNGDIGFKWSDRNITKSRSFVLVPQTSKLAQVPEPLSLRGWALQERLLSRRTLTFGLSKITWACGNYKGTSSFRERHKHAALPSWAPSEDHPKFWPNCWAKLVTDFTNLALRYPKDRLPALAGIAQRWADSLDDSYVAGLWRSSLPEALLWYVRDRAPAQGVNDTLLVPSWSWAAVEGRACLDTQLHFTTALYAKCLEVNIARGSSDSVFGAVAAGVVKLYGVLTPVRLEIVSRLEDYKVFVADDQDTEPPTMKVWLDRDVPVERTALYMLPISGCSEYFGSIRDDVNALLVAKNADGTFSRLGAVFISGVWQRLIEGSKQVVDLI